MMSVEPNSEKSVSYQKKDGRGHARPSFFWYDNDKDLKVCFLVTHLVNVYHCNHLLSWYDGKNQSWIISAMAIKINFLLTIDA